MGVVYLVDKGSEILLDFFLCQDFFLLDKSTIVIVGKVLNNALLSWLLDVVDLHFEVVVVAHSETSCHVELLDSFCKLMHFLMDHG